MKKILLSIALLAIVAGTASAQSFLERLGEKAKSAAENNLSGKVEQGVNNILDGKWGKKKDKKAKKAEEEVPVEVVEEEAAAPAVAGWTCEECGKE